MELVYFSLLLNFTLLVLLCYQIKQQGKFKTELSKRLQECLSLLVVLELNQHRPVQGCMEFKVSGEQLKSIIDKNIPPRI